MGRYITHEQLPFKGKLVKIRMRRYGFSNVASQLQNEEELLEITPDGIVKLSATRIDGREKCKVQIPVDDAAYIFNAFTTVFSEYSHNRRFGELFARGESYDQLAEGYYTVAAVMKLQEDYHVEMPISTAVYRILYENADLHDTLRDLFLRSIKQEFE